MKTFFSYNSHSLLYILFLLIIIIVIYIYSKQSKQINESFENNVKVNLTCNKDNDNIYNCKEFEPKTKIIKQNYPQFNYESGISNQSTSSKGTIQFKKKFNKTPSIHITPIQKDSNIAINELLNVNIMNPSKTGFSYIKNKIEKGLDEEFSEMLGLNPIKETQFNWLAIEQN